MEHQNIAICVVLLTIVSLTYLPIIALLKVKSIHKEAKRINDENRRILLQVTDPLRGTLSEQSIILRLLKSGASPDVVFHDLYLEYAPGIYAQIDIVLITKVGIVVIEDKDYAGWIIGNGHSKHWKQVMAYGKSRIGFYNPILQNQVHIKHLKAILQGKELLAAPPFFSIITFGERCTLKNISNVPDNTYVCYSSDVMDVVNKVCSTKTEIEYTDINAIVSLLKRAVENGNNWNIRNSHKSRLNHTKFP